MPQRLRIFVSSPGDVPDERLRAERNANAKAVGHAKARREDPAALLAAGVLAQQFPLHISLSEKVSVSSAVFFASILLLPPWQAAATVACSTASSPVTWRSW